MSHLFRYSVVIALPLLPLKAPKAPGESPRISSTPHPTPGPRVALPRHSTASSLFTCSTSLQRQQSATRSKVFFSYPLSVNERSRQLAWTPCQRRGAGAARPARVSDRLINALRLRIRVVSPSSFHRCRPYLCALHTVWK